MQNLWKDVYSDLIWHSEESKICPMKCEICEKSFSRHSDLWNTGERHVIIESRVLSTIRNKTLYNSCQCLRCPNWGQHCFREWGWYWLWQSTDFNLCSMRMSLVLDNLFYNFISHTYQTFSSINNGETITQSICMSLIVYVYCLSPMTS